MYFNPRSREGSDHTSITESAAKIEISIHAPVKGATFHGANCESLWSISIHAPVKGATCLLASNALLTSYFNPRSREGSDRPHGWPGCPAGHFNPRSREGSDGPRGWRCRSRSYFNPRSREGSDLLHVIVDVDAAISIHAPVKGATIGEACATCRSSNFNPRSREGSDRW